VARSTGKMSEKFPKYVEMIAVLVRFASGCSCIHFVSVLDDFSAGGSAIVRRIVRDVTKCPTRRKFVYRHGNQRRGEQCPRTRVSSLSFTTQ
jgi:hypothetical protein